ncbi:MAG: peptidoglycan DD-metalloendopeptidase family protein [Oscillospiraceae bacterium]|nr:peptidoglycan DD-metalloendopeptidase family protein [Oscillospiraceae bacterium]
MNLNPNALETAKAEIVPDSERKNIFESAMVNVGSLVTYLASAAVKRTLGAAAFVGKALWKSIVPLRIRFKSIIKNAARKLIAPAERFAAFNEKFKERIHDYGFGKAAWLQTKDAAIAVKRSRKFAKTVVNYTVPALSIAFLIFVVSDKASADYGVTVEYNGQEIGVVSEESVINGAQEVIADRATYYDAGSETYITATLSLKPLGSQDEVIDELALADAIQEQIIDTHIPVSEPESKSQEGALNIVSGSEVENVGTENTDINNEAARSVVSADESNKVRAYVVTVDGEVVGAVTENEEIDKFIEELKDSFKKDDVVDVSLDKDIEYTYENYVDPDQIVDQDEIVNLLDSVVAEPVFYEVKEGDNPWNIARNNDMSLEELDNCFITYDGEQIDDLTKYCPIGAVIQLSEEVPYLQVMTTKEVTYTEEIDYETITTEDPDMYKGESIVNVKGVEGEKEVKALVTYKNDVVVSREVIEEVVLSEPVSKEMTVGTRETRTPVSTGSGGSGDYFWPVDGGYISAYQGDRRGHKGIDIAAPYGTPIYAAESGTVIETGSGWNGGYGNCIKIEHADGKITLYGHQSSLAVEYGDYVVKGQLIGYVGSTGDSTGNHLHFEVRSNGSYLNPTDYVSQY